MFLATSRCPYLQHPCPMDSGLHTHVLLLLITCFYLSRVFINHHVVIACCKSTLFQEEYIKRGFSEVVTPNMYNTKLWERSGHWQVRIVK